MFILNHWFWNVQQIQFPTLDTGEATSLWKKLQKMISDDFDMDSYDFDFDTSINKVKAKGSLDKNLETIGTV